MDFFSKVLRPGSSSGENQPSGHETVERLCDRVESATLLDDRRDAVRALKSLAKKFRVEVGTRAMDLLINVLTQDRSDVEIVGLALEALVNVMGPEELTDEDKAGIANHSSDLGVQFTEIYLKTVDNVTTLLELLEEYDFRVRWPAVRLLTVLLMNKSAQIQQAILVSPLGVSRLMDLLSDSRDVIRNDGLLLLTHLCKGNAAIQKIVAFENAFDRLFEIIAEEGYCDGGIVVQDCLLLLQNLLKANVSNQNFFREGSYIQRFKMCLELDGEGEWSEQKIANVLLTLQVIRSLVSPSNPAQATQSSQRVIFQCGLLNQLCSVIMSAAIPTEALTEAVNTVAESIRGCQSNQEYFASVKAQGETPLSAAVVLLGIIINEKHQFSLRCAFLYCFQCFLFKNQAGQSQVISTLLPSSTAEPGVTAGQLLCSGLFRPDPFSNWASATALSHALKGSKELKEQLLRVQLATGAGNTPVSLLQQSMVILAQGTSSIQTRVGLFAFLCSWLSSCPLAVTAFLQNTAYIPFLTASVESHGEETEFLVQGLSALLIGVCIINNDNKVENFSRDDIKRLLMTRIDPEHFLSKISDVSKSSYFTDAAKSTEIQAADPADVLFDHEFTKLFKKLEASISKTMQADQDEEAGENEKNKIPEAHDSIVASYKELIRTQDVEISELKAKCTEAAKQYNQAERQLQTQAIELTKLRAQIELSKGVSEETGESETQASALLQAQLNALKDELLGKDETIRRLEFTLNNAQQALEDRQADSNAHQVLALEHSEHEKATLQLTNQAMIELDALRSRVRELEEERAAVGTQQIPGNATYTDGDGDSSRTQQLEMELAKVRAELQEQNQNYEDLLVLLDDQDKVLNKYKERLKELGERVDEDDDEEDDLEQEEDGQEEEKEQKSPPVQNEQQNCALNGNESTEAVEGPEEVIPPQAPVEISEAPPPIKVACETPEITDTNGSVRGESELNLSYDDDDY